MPLLFVVAFPKVLALMTRLGRNCDIQKTQRSATTSQVSPIKKPVHLAFCLSGSAHICGDFPYLLSFTVPLEATFLSSNVYLDQALCREISGISSLMLMGQRDPNGLGMRTSGAFADNYLQGERRCMEQIPD